jgi:amino acid adenylation domain-containing protein
MALEAVVARHEVLRTTYRLRDGRPVQVVRAAESVIVDVVDVAGTPNAWERALEEAARRACEPFDLSRRPPFRCVVWQGIPGGDAVLLSIHHIAVDGWSLAPLFEDLASAYEAAVAGNRPVLRELPIQYADFAAWDRESFADRASRRQVADRVAELLPVAGDLRLAGWQPRPILPEGARSGAQHGFGMPERTWSGVSQLARALRVTPFVVFLAAFQVVLQRWSGRDEFVVGIVTANRPLAELEELVGFFVNTVPLRCRLQPEWSFARLCAQVRDEAFRSLTYQRIPFDQLTAQAGALRASGQRSMVNVGFAFQNAPVPVSATMLPWESVRLLPTNTAKFDLMLVLEDGQYGNDGPVGTVEYDTGHYSPDVARQLGDNFRALLAAAVCQPDQLLPSLPIRERTPGFLPSGGLVGGRRDLVDERLARLGVARDRRQVEAKGIRAGATSVVDVLAARFAVVDPMASAVSVGADRVSWRELDSWASAVAGRLAHRGIGVGDLVPVLAARGGGLVAGWLGVLRTGAAYAPLGLDTPLQRLEHILAELGARAMLVDLAGAEVMADLGVAFDLIRLEDLRDVREPGRTAPAWLSGDEPAVAIYTSGSTGRPKGVLVSHRGLLNTVLWWADDVDLGPSDRLLCTWSTSFDGATHEVFRSLVAGSELVVPDDVERRDPRALNRMLRGPRGATVTSMTPSLLRAVLDADEGGATTLRALYLGGEGLPRPLAQECIRRWGVPIRNIYGPTEAACISTYSPVDLTDDRRPAIGVPLPNTRAYVLGPSQEELPVGVPGELYVAGVGVALGYLAQPQQTAKAFLPDPYAEEPDAQMYRTGDRVVLRDDGLLEHLGRVDDQVKILGHRIEPNEVRELLEEQPAVRAAAVLPVGEPQRLVAYVELSDDDASVRHGLPSRDEVLAPLLQWLPPAALPTEVLVVNAMPLTGNDKIDFRALRVMASTRLPEAPEQSEELTGEQRLAADLFLDALSEVDRVTPSSPALRIGASGNFFMLGGHSLLAVRMLTDAERRIGVRVPLRDFLANPTVAGLGSLLRHGSQVDPSEVAHEPPAHQRGAEPAVRDRWPATSVQERFWFIDHVPALRSAYVAPTVVEFVGTVDRDALRRAVGLTLSRHPALRSRFELDRKAGRVWYRTDAPPPDVTVVDASSWGPDEVSGHLAEFCWAPFDLAEGTPTRAEVISVGDRTLLVLVVHHIVADGWSRDVLMDQIAMAYRAEVEHRHADMADPVHPGQLVDPAAEISLDQRTAQVVARLRGAPTDIRLAHDRPRGDVQSTVGAICAATLGVDLTSRLRAVITELGCTTFMAAAALLAVALSRRNGQRDFLFAFPWAGREASGSEHAVGMFVNTLVLRVDLTDDLTWRELLVAVRENSMFCYRNADVPFDAVAAALHPDRNLRRPPLTPVYLSAQDRPPEPPAFGTGVTSRYRALGVLHLKYELELTATDHPEDLELAVSYGLELFDGNTITELMTALIAGAVDLVNDPAGRVREGM